MAMRTRLRRRATLTTARPVSLEWTNKERKCLIQALIHCHPNDVDGIAQYLPSRTKSEIEARIQSYKTNDVNSDEREGGPAQKNDRNMHVSNMEMWCTLVRRTVASFSVDLSYQMGQVCQVIAATEDMSLPPKQAASIRNIYLVLADLLSGRSPAHRLSRVESCLMWDCLCSLKETYSELRSTRRPTNIQNMNEYLKWKYALLSQGGHVDLSDRRVKTALCNEWAGFNGSFRPKPSDDPTMTSCTSSDLFTPGSLFTLNPMCIPHNLLQFNKVEGCAGLTQPVSDSNTDVK